MPNSTENKTFKWPVIKCPHCGQEYAPAEIFMPGELIGKPNEIVRDALGRIIYHEYEDDNMPGQSEHFVCDACKKPFVVEPVITYRVRKEDETMDFSDLSASLLD